METTKSNTTPPLFGLLLVGGKSKRMGVDKAEIIYRENTPEWKRLHTALSNCCEQTFLCHRADQDFGEKSIIDPADGPLRAIQSAQAAHPEAAWLVLACDMPLVDSSTLELLISNRDADKDGTCYLSPIDQLPEPLCAIYEPSLSPKIAAGLTAGNYCPRGYLTSASHLTSNNPSELMNANTQADQIEVTDKLQNTQSSKNIELIYFAQLKDLVSKDSESLTTLSSTASGVYEEIKATYQFPYKQKDLMLAINDEFSPWETILKEGDSIVFIPPVAGG